MVYVLARNRYIFRGFGAVYKNLNHDDAVAAFPELRLVFNRIKKAGNSSTTAFLWELAAEQRGERAKSTRETKKSSLSPLRATWQEAVALREYTYFTVVRNPYDRALSAFLQKVARGQDGNDSRKRRFRVVPGWGDPSPKGFENFVDFLEKGGLKHDRHWWPQVDLLIIPAEQFDVIGRLETLSDDMARLLTVIGRDPAKAELLRKPHPLEAKQPNKITGATSKRVDYYTPALAEKVRRLYAADFDTFGYPDDWA